MAGAYTLPSASGKGRKQSAAAQTGDCRAAPFAPQYKHCIRNLLVQHQPGTLGNIKLETNWQTNALKCGALLERNRVSLAVWGPGNTEHHVAMGFSARTHNGVAQRVDNVRIHVHMAIDAWGIS